MTDAAQSNTFLDEAIEVQIARSTTLSKTALPQHFQAILQAINDLEKRLTKATEFIPSYDERQYSRVSSNDLVSVTETQQGL